MIKFRDVVVENLILFQRAQILGVFRQNVLRPRPRRVAMREVVGPHQALDVAQVLHLERDLVVLERGVDVLAEVLAGHLLQFGLHHPVSDGACRHGPCGT